MINKKILITIVCVAVVFFIFGYFVSAQLNKPQGKLGSIVKGQNTFQAGWEAAKKRLAETGFAPMAAINMEIKTVSGEIKEIKGNRLV